MPIYQDLTGQKFGKLKVIKRVENDKWGQSQWLCECDCDSNKKVIVRAGGLKFGNIQSCGCLTKENVSKANKKYNKYDLSGEYGIGYIENGESFYFDIEDYDLIKDYRWNINNYCFTVSNKKTIFLHRLIMNNPDLKIDHINRNKLDNRKSNLRLCTSSQNNMNKTIPADNTSGIIGVCYNKLSNRWQAYIQINKIMSHLGFYKNIDDAIIARLNAEYKYYGEFAPQQHLYEQYGIPSI